MKLVHCLECDWEGKESNLDNITTRCVSEFWGARQQCYDSIAVCPCCGSEEIEDLIEEEVYSDE